jgi:hypothetical protein
MSKYKLTDATHAEILKEIQARRTKTAYAGPADANHDATSADGTTPAADASTPADAGEPARQKL